MNLRKILIMLPVLLVACTTYKNANEGGYSVLGGGYTDKQIEEGIYRITAESGVSPVSQKSSVEKVWRRRANELCSGSFQENRFEVDVIDQGFTYMNQGTIGYYVSRASGYAICSIFNGTMEDAIAIINKPAILEAQKKAREEALFLAHIKDGCDTDNMDVENLERLGNVFLKNRIYDKAMTCYLGVYEKDKKYLVKIEVYKNIGLMYEIGLGVEESMDEAKRWYKLAKLI